MGKHFLNYSPMCSFLLVMIGCGGNGSTASNLSLLRINADAELVLPETLVIEHYYMPIRVVDQQWSAKIRVPGNVYTSVMGQLEAKGRLDQFGNEGPFNEVSFSWWNPNIAATYYYITTEHDVVYVVVSEEQGETFLYVDYSM